MKLEIRHLSPYLPYGLKIKDSHGKISALRQLEYCRPYNKEVGDFTDEIGVDGYYIQYIKPILRPLSDLTKEIDGENKTYLDHLNFETGINDEFIFADGHLLFIPDNDTEYNMLAIPYEALEFLKEHHFDIFGLIDAGLAIDINSLDN